MVLRDKQQIDDAGEWLEGAWTGEPEKLSGFPPETLEIAEHGIYLARTGVDYDGRPLRKASELVAGAARAASSYEATRDRLTAEKQRDTPALLEGYLKAMAKRSF